MDILSMNPLLLFGTAGFVGAGVRGIIAYYKAKKISMDKVEFDQVKFSNTLVNGIGAAIAFSIGLPVTYISLLVTAIASAGADTYLNKFGIKIIPMLRDFAKKKKIF